MMIDDLCQGRKIVVASELIVHRNTTQHALLSLPPRTGTAECCRLAALIYSLLVTYPLPYIAAPFKLLVKQLKIEVAAWDGSDDMLIWVLTMGAIGALGLKEREWFVENFLKATTTMGMRSWSEAREVIKRGLWYEPTNEADGKDLWIESRTVSD